MFRGPAVPYRQYFFAFLLLVFASSAFGQGTRAPKEADDPGEKDRPAQREQWFRRGRTLKGQSGAALRYRAYQDKMSRRTAAQTVGPSARALSPQSKAPLSPSPAGPAWVPMGPAPIGVDTSASQNFGVNSGRVTTVVVDQNDPSGNTVYAGAAYGGLWRSKNAANPDPSQVQWTPLIDDQPTLAVGAVALKPDDSNTILVGTGEANNSGDSYYGLGFLRSTDGGATWSLIASTSDNSKSFKGLAFSSIAFSADNPSLVVAASTNSNAGSLGIDTSSIRGLYYSTDAGASWQYASVQDNGVTITPASTSSVVYHPALHKFFAAVRFHGFYSSTDGANWTRLAVQPGNFLPASVCPASVSTSCPIFRGQLAIQPVTGDIYAWFIDANDAERGLYKSSNGGATWVSVGTTGIDSCGDPMGCGTTDQGDYDLELAAVPNGAGTDLYAGAINIYKCSLAQGGSSCATWLNLTHVYGCSTWGAPAHVHPDQHGVDYSRTNPSLLYFGHDGGVSRALNGPGLLGGACTSTNAFDNLSGTLGSLTEFVSFSEHPTDDSTLLGGAQDVGSAAIDSSHPGTGTLGWLSVNAGDGGFNAINPSNPLEWFTANTDVTIQRCTSGIGCNYKTFLHVISNNTLSGDHGDFYTPYILDPGLPSKIIVATCRIWRGNSDGTGWSSASALSTNFDTGSSSACNGTEYHLMSALAAGGPLVPGGGSPKIYAGDVSGNVWVSSNATVGLTGWQNWNIGGSDKVSDIFVDPSDATGGTAYATVMGFAVAHVWKTTNGGQSWSSISGDLPDAPANSVAVDPNDPTVVYVGTDVGVFATTNGGQNWTEWGAGLPNAPVTRIRSFVSQDKTKNKLRVSTYGRGVWQTDLLTASPFRASAQSSGAAVFIHQAASYTLNVIAQAAFNGTVTISCDSGGNPLPDTCVGGTISPAKAGTPFTVTASNASAGNFNFSLKLVASDSNSTTVEIPVTLEVDDLQMSAPSPSGLVLKRGQSSQFSFTLTALGARVAGLSAVVTCTGLPAGATCTPAPSPVYLGGNTAPTVTVTVNTDFNATPPGNYAPAVVASLPPLYGQPAYTASQAFSLEVDPNVDFTLASNPSSAALPVGQNPPTFNITLDSHDAYTGNVTLGCSIDQPGPSCSIAPGPYSTFPSVVQLAVNLNSLTSGSFKVTVSGNDGNHTNTLVVPVSLADFRLGSLNGTPAAVGYSGTSGTFTFYVQSLNGYNRQVQVTCDSTAISPQSVCTPDSVLFNVSTNFTWNETIHFNVPAAITSGTFPVHILVTDVLSGAPQHALDIMVTVQGFTLTRTGPLIQSGPLGQYSQNYNLVYTPTGGMNQSVTFYCQSSINVTCNFTPPMASSAQTNVTAQVSVWSQADATQFPDGKVQFTPSGYLLNTFRIPGDGPLTYQVYDVQIPWPIGPNGYVYGVLIPGGPAQQIPFQIFELGSTAPVSLSCTPPAGITCSFSPNVLNGSGTSSLILSAASTVSLSGNISNITLNASGNPGGTPVTRTLTFIAYVGTFTQNVSPSSATIAPGGAADFSVFYTGAGSLGPYGQAFNVGCGNLPAGVSCTITPSAVTFGQTATAHISTTSGVTPSSFTFSITGTADGVTKSTSIPVKLVDFAIASNTSSTSLNAGSSAPVSFTVTGQNGFTSTVTLSCPAVAPGISCTFSPNSFVPTSTGTLVSASILTTAATPPGVYTVPLTATGNGVAHTVNFTLTVKNFHAAVQPATAITPVGGGKATYALTYFADQGFNSPLTLSCVSPPAGVTCAFSPLTLTPTAAGVSDTLTVTVASTVPQGSNTLNIRAAASILSQTIPVTLLTGADFSLATVTAAQTVQQTQSADFHITATALGGMNQPVTLSCPNLPNGITCQFSQNPVTPASGGQDVDVTVATSYGTLPTSYTISVQGTSGGITHNTILPLTVQFLPDFVLNYLTSTPGGIRPGQTANFTTAASKNGSFSSIVDLACAGTLPAGATCQVQPASVDFSTAINVTVSVTVTTAANTPLADTAFSLHGVERGGTKVHDLPLTLHVSDFHLSAPAPATFAQTGAAAYVVSVFSDNGFNGPVTLSCNNLPVNVGPCSFSANNVTPLPGGTAVTVSFPVGATAAVGPTSFDVVATGGNTSHTVTEPLNIILVQDFTVATMSPLTLPAMPGQTVGWGVLLTPLNSFAASLNLTISGCPTGFTCSLQPGSPIAVSNQIQQPVNLLVQVPANAAAVNNNLTLTATDPVSGKTHALALVLSVQSFTLTTSPVSASVVPGAGAIFNVTLNPLNGFNQTVLIACNNLPSDITCSSAPAVPGQAVPITVMTAPNAVQGYRPVQIGGALGLGAPANIGVKTVSLSVSSFNASYTLTAASTTQTAPVGSSASYSLTVRSTRSSFTSPVTLSCLPNATLSCSFSSPVVFPSTLGMPVTLTVTPSPQLNPGSYPIVVQGLGGNQVRQLPLTINVADFWITVSPGSQLIPNPNGGTASYTVTAQTSSNFNLPLTLSCPGAPSGVTCAFVPPSLTPTTAGATSALTVTTTAASPKGLLNLNVQAASGAMSHQSPFQLTNGQDFSLALAPPAITVLPGGNNSTSVNIGAIGPFTSNVVLSCGGTSPPAALICTFPGQQGAQGTPGSSVPLNISATSSVTGGVYTVSLQGSGGGLTHTVPLTVNVPDYSVSLALDASVSSILVGGAPLLDGTLSAIAGFSSSVTLSCSAPAPLACVNFPVAPIAVTANGAPFSFSVSVPSGTAPGSYPLQVNADDGAGHLHHANLTLVVKDFSVSLNSGSATIEAGTSTMVSGTVTGINGFTGNVQFACPGGDPNITCVFTPPQVAASAGGTAFSVTVSTAPATPPMLYSENVAAAATGVANSVRVALFNLTVTPTNDFNVFIGLTSLPINAGDSSAFHAQVTAVNAFNATVTMTCTGAPAGLTCTPPAPFAVPPGGNMNIGIQTVVGVITPGSYNLTLTSSGGGKTHTQTLTVVVRDFSISVTPPAQTVLPGVEADYSVSMLTSSGFFPDALFTCSIAGSPAGAGCSFDQPNLSPGSSTTLRVTSTAATPPGTYTVNLTAAATAGATVHTASVSVQLGGPDFSLSPSSITDSVARGTQHIDTVTVTALQGLTAPVSFSCTPTVPNIYCSVQASITPTAAGTSFPVVIRSLTTAAVGSYQFTLTGTAAGKTHSIPINVTIN